MSTYTYDFFMLVVQGARRINGENRNTIKNTVKQAYIEYGPTWQNQSSYRLFSRSACADTQILEMIQDLKTKKYDDVADVLKSVNTEVVKEFYNRDFVYPPEKVFSCC